MSWPRLTTDLPHSRRPEVCQSCGREATELWEEHDDNDKPEQRFVALCRPCAAKLIEPHPRLYRAVESFEPIPGGMSCCAKCFWLYDMRCESMQLKRKGGPGLHIRFQRPATVFVCVRGGGGGPRNFYQEPPKCMGLVTDPRELHIAEVDRRR